jgi:tetratricopeptide (TPR) repeat protein
LQADVAFKRGLYTLGNPELNEHAVAALDSAHRLAPRQRHYTVYLARGLAELGAGQEDPAARDELYARAEALLVTALDGLERDAGVRLELGRVQAHWADQTEDPAAREERIGRALANFRDALALSPGRTIAWNAYGSALAIAKRREEALASFEHSLALDPRFAETYLLGARIQAELGRPEDALAVLERGTRVAEPSAALHRALADGYASLGRSGDAAGEYAAALSIDPRHRGSHVGRVRLSLRGGDCPGAAAALEEMARRLPRDPALPGLRETLATACPEPGAP